MGKGMNKNGNGCVGEMMFWLLLLVLRLVDAI